MQKKINFKNIILTVFIFIISIIVLLFCPNTFKPNTPVNNEKIANYDPNTGWKKITYSKIKVWNNAIVSDYDRFSSYTPIEYKEVKNQIMFRCNKKDAPAKRIITFSKKGAQLYINSIQVENQWGDDLIWQSTQLEDLL